MIRSFLEGFSAYFKVIPLFTKLKLWKYVLLTAGISFVILSVLVLISYQVYLFTPASLIPGEGYWDVAGKVLLALLFFVGGIVMFKHLVLIITAPWLGRISATIAQYFELTPKVNLDLEMREVKTLVLRSLRLNTRLVFAELLITIPLTILGWIPLFSVPALVLLVLVQSYFVGAGAMDYCLESQYNYQDSKQFLSQNKAFVTGAGLGFVLLLFTVFGFLVAPAWSVSAASYAYFSRLKETTGQGIA